MIGTYDVSNLACQGYLLDLNSQVPGLDLTKEWWDQKANEDLSMKGKMYFTTGDISTLDNDCTYCILFNKKLIDDYNMDDPYEMVKNKTWTMDNFVSMARKVSVDLDGDTKMTENDPLRNVYLAGRRAGVDKRVRRGYMPYCDADR